nr:arginine-glutamic acid dipeptide repeats protein-like [Aegilops tauschii subsp. strangulata]
MAANQRCGCRRPKVEDKLEDDAAGLPAGCGSVSGVEDDVAELMDRSGKRGRAGGRGNNERRRRCIRVAIRWRRTTRPLPASAAPPPPLTLPPAHLPQHHPAAPEPWGPVATNARRPLRPASATTLPRSPAAPSPPPPGAPSARPAPLRRRATPAPGAPGPCRPAAGRPTPATGVDRMVGKGPECPEPPASATGRGGSIIPSRPLRRALLDKDSYSDDELVEKGKKVYKRGCTKLPPVPTTPDQRGWTFYRVSEGEQEAAAMAIVEKERLKTKELLEDAKREAQREAAEREREMDEKTDKLLEEERNQNDSASRALYELIVVRFSCIFAQSCT